MTVAVGQDLDTDHEIVKKLTLGEVNEKTVNDKIFLNNGGKTCIKYTL